MRTLTIGFALAACGLGLPAAAQTVTAASLAGEWKGTLMGQLPLVLHLEVDPQGALKATMDSPSQGANGLAGDNVKLTGASLSLDIPSVGGNYVGTVAAGGKSITGTWTQQGHSLALEWTFAGTAAQAAAAQAAVQPSPIEGDWAGALHAGGQTLRVVFHFKAAPDGILCSFDSLDQNSHGIPCGDVKVSGKRVSLDAKAVNGTYSGSLRSDGNHIDGTWSQGSPLELDLVRQ
ncbi:MAG TPA: hypothetical protein VME68_06235 [Acidobacteriaceae bacterium]|nr:hypothetical protein [Acidobacteriaceae bacterium]